MLELACN